MKKRFTCSFAYCLFLTLVVHFGCTNKTVQLTNDTLHWGDDACTEYELQLNSDSSFCQKITICDIAMPTVCCGKYTYIADTLFLLTEAEYFLKKNTLVDTTECEKGKVIFKIEGYPYVDFKRKFIEATYFKILAQKNGMGEDTISVDEYPIRKNGRIDIAVKIEKIVGYDYMWLDDGMFFKGIKVPIEKEAKCQIIKYPVIQRDHVQNLEHCTQFYAMKPRIIKRLGKKNFKFLFRDGGKVYCNKIN